MHTIDVHDGTTCHLHRDERPPGFVVGAEFVDVPPRINSSSAARDPEFDRWLAAETETGEPLACIVVDGEVVGWIDYDVDREWLEPGEVNVGYFLIASARGHGYATRAVELFLLYLAAETDHRVATLLIDVANERSLGVASRANFERAEDIGGGAAYFKRAFR